MAVAAGADAARVVPGAGSGDLVLVGLGPDHDGLDLFMKRPSQWGELVFDTWRHHRVHRPVDQTVPLELAQGDGQHPLADAIDLPAQLVEAQDTLVEQGDHEHGPLVGDPVEDLANFAILACIPLKDVVIPDVVGVGIHAVRRFL